MALVQKISQQIGLVGDIRKNIITLVEKLYDTVFPICGNANYKWSIDETTANKKSQLFNYFSLQTYIKDGSLINLQIQDVNLFNHPMLYVSFFFLILFTIVFLLSFFLYFNFGRRCWSILTCGLCLRKKKPIGITENAKYKRNNSNACSNNPAMRINDIENGEHNGDSKKHEAGYDEEKTGVVNNTENNENVVTDSKTNENEVKGSANQNTKRKRSHLLALFFGFVLLISLIIVSIYGKINASNSEHQNTKIFCHTFNMLEDMLIGTCPSRRDNENTKIDDCFTAADALDDGLVILESMKIIIKNLDEQKLLTREQNILFLQDIETYIEQLEKLSNNLDKNNSNMLTKYKHSLIFGIHGKEAIDEVVEKFKKKKVDITSTAYKSRDGLIELSNQLYKLLNENVEYILNEVNKFLKSIITSVSDPKKNAQVNSIISNSINVLYIIFYMFMAIMVIILVMLCVCTSHLIKGNENRFKKLIVKMVGFFSAYFGIITIPIMLITLFFIMFSMLGSTMCVLSEQPKALNDIIPKKATMDIPIVGTCILNENALLVDESYINGIIQRVNHFDVDTVLEQMDIFMGIQQELVNSLEVNFNKVADVFWITQADKDKISDLLKKIENESLKDALLATHIYKHHVENTPNLDDVDIVRSVDEFLIIANSLLLNPGYELCYEENECENTPNKFNITEYADTNDSKYQNIRNNTLQNNDKNKESLDAIFEILKLKAKLIHDRMFIISDLTPHRTEKLLINEYVGPTTSSSENSSYIHTWLNNWLLEIKKTKHFMQFKNIVLDFALAKNKTISQVKKYEKKLNCQVALKGAKALRDYLCYGLMFSVMQITVICFVMGILTSLLWLYFLCIWLKYKMTLEREELETYRQN